MGLQVWLPLNGNLENKGLGEIDNVQGTPSYRTNGKIGSALELNQRINLSCNNLKNLSTFTICFWVCIDDSTTLTENWVDIIGFTDISTTGTSGTFRCETSYGNSDWKGAHWHDNATYALIGNTISGTMNHIRNNNIWQHCAVVCDNEASKISFYTDGELTGEFVHKGGTFNNTGTFYLGHTNKIMGAINDIRFYDEALSPLQIKQISQGLVAHYLLDNNGGLPNLLNKTPKFYGSGGYNAYQLNLSKNLEEGKTYTIQFWDVNVSHSAKTADALGISVYWGGGNIALKHLIGTNYFTNGHADYLTATFTITSSQANHANAVNAWLNIYNSFPNADGTRFMSIGDWKIEENSEPTAWTFNADNTNKNIEYDVSGYCHNGTKYNITDYSSDTPRYSVSTVFNGSNSYINIGRSGMVRDEVTINAWAYMDDWTAFSRGPLSCTEGGGWCFEKASNKIRFAIGTGSTSNTYKTTVGFPLSDLTSGWHMITGTYDGLVLKEYVDGVLNTSTSAYTTKTPAYYHASNSIIIGAEATGSGVTTPYFNGRISDVRIYATALSDADVLALYKNSAYIDSFGNVFASEYKEG